MLIPEEEKKEVQKYIEYIFRKHGDVFNKVYSHLILHGHITEKDIEDIVHASIYKNPEL